MDKFILIVVYFNLTDLVLKLYQKKNDRSSLKNKLTIGLFLLTGPVLNLLQKKSNLSLVKNYLSAEDLYL